MGLVHYRRYLSLNHQKSLDTVLSSEQVADLLKDHDIVLPPKRRYYIETNESHYLHAHEHEPFEVMRQVIHQDYPEYAPAFEKVMKRTWAHMFNMFIAKSAIFDEYTDWLMDVLFEVEKRTDITGYTPYEQRIYGFISELLMDVWVEKNEINYTEVPVMFMGKQHWVKKITSFLMGKIKGNPNKDEK